MDRNSNVPSDGSRLTGPSAFWRLSLLCALAAGAPACLRASVTPRPRVVLDGSIVAIPGNATATRAHIVRTQLRADESAVSLDIVVSLRMRAFGELEARIQEGQRIPHPEMEAKYLPLESDYERVASWLSGQGFVLFLKDSNHTNVFARGTLAQITGTLNVAFARVATGDGEFSSAVTPPSIPEALSGVILGITGLQPHILMRPPRSQRTAGNGVSGFVTPADVRSAYDAPTDYDGTGQTIAIIMDAVPLETDLTAFWQAASVNQSLANYSVVDVGVGAISSADQGEASLDVEWASGIAPGVKLRLYAISALNLSELFGAYTEILNDGAATVVSYSAGGTEDSNAESGLQSGTQMAAQLGAAGITVLSSSGDGGSNPNPNNSVNGYDPGNPLTVLYPASDPNVTSVGGTTTTFDANWTATSETAWSEVATVSLNPLATGGGLSGYFLRPSWQIGSSIPVGTMRCVPDVAAMASANPISGNTGGFVVLGGQQTGFIGTSLSTPIWAGVVAITNQYRAAAGLPNVGLLNRWLYSLIGSNAFFDITTGTNGAYVAGTGYDFCTGAGTPDIIHLMTQTSDEITEVGAPADPIDAGSPVTMSVTAQLSSSTYQWLLNGVNIQGATGAAYTILNASVADSGAYSVSITSVQFGTLTFNLGTLTVNASPPVTPVPTSTRLVNISTRAQVGIGSNLLIPGFVISGTGTETLLIRGDGPSLAQFGVGGVLSEPSLSVFDNTGQVIASNTGWGTSANPALIAATSAEVGAFVLPSGSADCALIVSLPAGNYTVQVSGISGTTGVALAEIYEVSSTGTRLINISTRAQVGTGSNLLIPGFYISGSGTEQLLVRGDGPALSQFGVSGTLAQPSLSVFDSSGAVIASNTGWGTNPDPAQIATVSAKVGAFVLPPESADCSEIVRLSPGAYTVHISGVGNSTGVALAELYEVH
jgi:kumamolisin